MCVRACVRECVRVWVRVRARVRMCVVRARARCVRACVRACVCNQMSVSLCLCKRSAGALATWGAINNLLHYR